MSAAYCLAAPGHPLHGPYHDREYGFPATDDAVLFERLVLEINQAGLSWLTVLKKREAFRAAFAGFAVDPVAAFGDADVARLLGDAGIVRNRLKIEAVVDNARRIQELRRLAWLVPPLARGASSAPARRLGAAVPPQLPLYRREIVGEFLMSLGYLPGAHVPECPVYGAILALAPPWARREPHGPN